MAEDVKKDEKKAEKPLEKMTVVELREVAKEEIPGITGMSTSLPISILSA